MEIFVKVDVLDVSTRPIGENFELILDKGLNIIFTREAMDELIKDYYELKTKDSI